jgi:hypothetical protein
MNKRHKVAVIVWTIYESKRLQGTTKVVFIGADEDDLKIRRVERDGMHYDK